jgi:hypothetical protein
MPQLRCGCGTPINLFMGLKGLTEMDEMMEAAHNELEANNLEKAQDMYTSNMMKLDKVLAPPYPDYYKIQQQIWKCIWMRHGNRIVTGHARKPVVPGDDEYDTVD